MSAYWKAIVAFLATAVGALSSAVASTPHQSLGEIGTLGWLLLAGTILGVPAAVFFKRNQP